MVEREGFEPSKAAPADLQSAPFDHLGTSPCLSTGADEGTRTLKPADYKSAALPIELRRLVFNDKVYYTDLLAKNQGNLMLTFF